MLHDLTFDALLQLIFRCLSNKGYARKLPSATKNPKKTEGKHSGCGRLNHDAQKAGTFADMTNPKDTFDDSEERAEGERGLPSPAQMLAALQKSGYLFEHEIALALEDCGFFVERGIAFEDPNEGKSREIDIKGFKTVLRNSAYKTQLMVDIFVECKDVGAPFVFMTAAKNVLERERPEAREYVFPYSHSTNVATRPAARMMEYGFSQSHYYYREHSKVVQFAKIARGSKKKFEALHDNVYDALILPQTKAVHQFLAKQKPSRNSANQWEDIRLVFNVIVLRDHLFKLDLDTDGALPEPTGRASFVRHIETDTVKGRYLIDFVTQAHFTSYIKDEVLGFANAIADSFKETPRRFRSHGAVEKVPQQ